MKKTIRVAAAQFTPYFLDRKKTVQKICDVIEEAGESNTRLIVFPESFIPGYPDWVWLLQNSRSAELNALYTELVENAISIPDESTRQICAAAREAEINVVLGINELNSEASAASIYNSLLFIDDTGEIIGKHRKLIPTGGERLVWSQGDGSTLGVFDTSAGRLGGLICWEMFMPLARHAMYGWGTQILAVPTWDKSPNWMISLQHVAREGGCFVISSCMTLRKDDIPDRYEFKTLYPADRDWISKGNSCIVAPNGQIIAGPLEAEEGLLYADIDLSDIIAAKRIFDATGHYARPDVFGFSVNKKANNNIETVE